MKVLENEENTKGLLNLKCRKRHEQGNSLRQIAFTIFNINAKNFLSQLNDAVHKEKKGQRERASAAKSESTMKIRKLQSEGSS